MFETHCADLPSPSAEQYAQVVYSSAYSFNPFLHRRFVLEAIASLNEWRSASKKITVSPWADFDVRSTWRHDDVARWRQSRLKVVIVDVIS